MAKAKKPTTKTKASSPKPAQATNSSIDPAAAASLAAAMIGRKVAPAAGSDQPSKVTESTSFRNLKDSLAKPHAHSIGGVLDKISPGSAGKSGLPFAGGKQVGHNQTFGADASKKNVPRRTGG